MGRSNKFDYHAVIEKELIAHPDGVSLDELLACCGLKVDRSTLFRHLAQMIEKGRVERTGNARASRYRQLNGARADTDPGGAASPRPTIQPVPESPVSQPANAAPLLSPGEVRPPAETGHADAGSVAAGAAEYETAVKKAVRTVVREWKRCNRVNLQIYHSLLVKPEHLDEVTAAVEKELDGLREGDLARFGLSPTEFRAFTPVASQFATDR
jgi:hypothetical protein